MSDKRPPIIIDMTPEGEFRDPPPPPAPRGFQRVLARLGGVAMLVALGAGGLRRFSALPDLPTISELGYPGFDWDEWNGLWTVAGTPAASIAKLYAATIFALNQPDVQARMNQIGIVPLGTNPEQFGAFVVEQRERTARLIREANITLG
jgi:tripartite-type tricarboxylate transporter receptor subunit TctC